MAGGGNFLNIYIDGTLVLSDESVSTSSFFGITSTGFKKSSASSNAWTYSGNLEFLGFSLTQGATTAHDSLRVGYTIDGESLYSFTNYTGNLYLYSVEGIPDRAISLENLYEFKDKLDAVPTCYRHDVVITDSSNSSKICFNLILKNSSALTVETALTCLFGALTTWKKTSIPITLVTSEWSSAVFFPRCVLSSISKSGSSVTSFTLTPTEGSIVYDQVNGLLTISSAERSFIRSNLSIEDSVVGLSL